MSKTLEDIIRELDLEEGLIDVIRGISQTCAQISLALRNNIVKLLQSKNLFGDEQISSDILADNKITQWAENSKYVRAYSSEENPLLNVKESCEGEYVVCWDPLDGSSIMECNFAVGSIFAVWKINENGLKWNGVDTLIGATGRQLVCSLMVIYGPRLSFLVSLKNKTYDFTYIEDNYIFTCLRKIRKSNAKIFAPANLRCYNESEAYKNVINYWLRNRYTLRYTGGLVPDVYHILVKNEGIFCNPVSTNSPAKLRLIFECIPIAFLIENAEGKSSNGYISILDKPIEKMNEKIAFCVGTEEEVLRYEFELRNENQKKNEN